MILRRKYAYYDLDAPLADADYDRLLLKLQQVATGGLNLIQDDSPTRVIGGAYRKNSPVPHRFPCVLY